MMRKAVNPVIKSKIGKEITSIYTRDGKEIIEVRDNQNNIVYSAIDEISGVPPLSFMSHGGYLQDCRIYGNTVQNGTPTPENPVEVQGCGEYDAELNGYKIPVTVALPYEPYHEPITTSVYVGSEPLHKIGDYADYIDFERGVVVRNIKKTVLTGDEKWIDNTNNQNQDVYKIEKFANFRTFSDFGIFRCTHILYMHPYTSDLFDRIVLLDASGSPHILYMSTKKSRGLNTLESFKSYIATQYAVGTPVTVWYVLAKPEEERLENLLPIQAIKGTNILTVGTTVQPSEIYIKGKIKSIT